MYMKKVLPLVFVLLFVGTASYGDYLRGIVPVCDWRSLSHPGCEEPFCHGSGPGDWRYNYSRDFPMGNGAPPMLSNFNLIRDYPFPGEFLTIQMNVQADVAAGDSVEAQFLLWGEIAYSTTGGVQWHANGEPVIGFTSGPGLSMDWFTREVLHTKTGSNMYKHFEAQTRQWQVPHVNAKWMSGDPSPNRRQTATLVGATYNDLPLLPPFPGWAEGYESMERYKTFGQDKCPWSLNCRLFDSYPENNGTSAANPPEWPAGYGGLSCSRGADNPLGTPGVDNCNVPGFPEGGGDLLDYFPACDPNNYEFPCDPCPALAFPNIPGEPLVRVNGVPGISCDLYDDTNLNWTTETHPLCGNNITCPIDTIVDNASGRTAQDVYDLYGIKPYWLQPMQGVVKFGETLDPFDVVDAVFYTDGRRIWTAKIDMNDPTLSDVNSAGSQFRVFPWITDTCNNIATGGKAHSTNAPTFNPTTNESTTYVMGGNDSDWDLIPTDLDPLTAWLEDVSFRDGEPSICSATDTLCPDGLLPVGPPLFCEDDPAPCACADEYCECCYNECDPTLCTYLGSYWGMCANTGDDGNPPGCGSEYGGNTGQLEIEDFKVSHTSANLYLKLKTQGNIEWGCYGVWYIPIVSCEFLGDQDQKSKINAYAFQVVNTDPDRTGTYFLLIVPSIEGLYGPIIAFLDLPALMGEMASYDGTSYDCSYADGAGGACADMCEKGDELTDCEEIGCDPENTCPDNPECGPNGNCDGDAWINSADSCPCTYAEEAESDDGCPPSSPDDDGFDKYMCKSCALEGGEGDTDYIYLEMGYEGTVNSAGAYPYSIYAATISIHDLSEEFMDDLLCILCQKGFVFEKLLSDMTPKANYFARGPLSQTVVEVRNDTIPPVAPQIEACLGRCGAYDPSTTTIEVKWPEVVFNDDQFPSDLVDLGGYKVYVSRGGGTAFSHYYTICSPDETDDCSQQSPATGSTYVARTDKNTDEPFAYTRFPMPFDQLKTDSGFNYPGEPISMIIDSDCDVPGNSIDDDKDGDLDEGCYAGAPDTDETPLTHANSIRDADLSLNMDGQEYWFRVTAYDSDPVYSGPPFFPALSAYHATSTYSNIAKVKVLRNTTPPAPPKVRAVYSMGSGRTLKAIWEANTEIDLGGYAIYRCPGNPIDAVRIAEGDLAVDYCLDDNNYRRVSKDAIAMKATGFIDGGKGFYEGGIGDNDDGDGTTSEWIDCTSEDPSNADLELCGNLVATWTAGAALNLYSAADPDRPVLFPTGLVDGYEYYYKLRAIDSPYRGDGTNDPGTCTAPYGAGGVGGYTYTNGVDAFGGGTGCVNPIDDSVGPPPLTGRQCADPTVKNDWEQGGNCSDLTPKSIRMKYEADPLNGNLINRMFFEVLPAGGELRINPGEPLFNSWSIGVPSDYKAPSKPVEVQATSTDEGTAVSLTWRDHSHDVTFDHYRIYRTNVNEGYFACLRGSCETTPYRDGCPCAAHTDCVSYDAVTNPTPCEVPWTICTNPPDYTIKATVTDCPNAGCECNPLNDDCDTATTGRECRYPAKPGYTGICKSAAADPDMYIDNDGDGMIDEELADSIDNDGDGLVDEDSASGDVYTVGKCPSGTSLKDTTKAEVVLNNYYTELYLEPGNTYYYKVSAVDNAKYNDPEEPNIVPNESARSTTVVVATRDTKAPDPPTGPCPYSGGLPTGVKPCAEIVAPNDSPGGSLTVTWFSTATLDIEGYHIYMASDPDKLGNPTTSQFDRVNSTMIPVPTSTDTIQYNVDGLQNDLDYYFAVTAVDESNNESNFSDVAGPAVAQDTVATSEPEWNPNYRDHSNCTNLPPSSCSTDVNHSCDMGGVTAYGKTGTLKIDWAPQSETTCVPTSRTEGDFSYYNLYRRHYTAATGTETCSPTSNQDCTIVGNDCMLASGITETEFVDDGCIQYRTQPTCDAVSGCEWSAEISECKSSYGGILENGKTYYYCVTAVDQNDNESVQSTVNYEAPVDNLPPDKPTGLVATPLAGTKVGLGWALLDTTQFTDLAGYVIYRSTSSSDSSYQRIDIDDSNPDRVTVDQSGTTVEAINSNSYDDNYNLVTGKTYYYKITAIDASGNESKKSDPASVIPVDADNTPPSKATNMYSRPGYDLGESGGTAGVDDDGDGFIDDTSLGEKTVELHWDSIKDYDLVSYNVYRLDPPALSDCSYTVDPAGDCDEDDIPNSNDPSCDNCCGSCPLDDCDKDGYSNAIDSCPCTPLSPETSPFGTYNLVDDDEMPLSKTTACPAGDHVRPVGTLSENTCYYTDSPSPSAGETLCNGSRHWYIVTGIDLSGNETALDTSTAHPVTPVEKPDGTKPETPLNEGESYDWKKPKIVAPAGGGKLIVVFYENDMTVTKNQDIQGYTVYRDTNFNGDFATKKTLLSNKMVECTQQGLPACHCDKANILDACYLDLGMCGESYWVEGKTYDCYLDVDVINDKKYFYKIDAFDEVPNYSDKTSAGSGKPQVTESIPSPVGFQVNATMNDPNTLVLIWSYYNLDNNPNFAGFMLYRANAASGTYNLIDPEPSTTAIELIDDAAYIDSGLISGEAYYYWLYSVDTNGEKSDQPAQCCRSTGDCSHYYCYGIPGTDIVPPLPPTGLVAVPGDSSVTLTWNAVTAPDLAGYNICRGTTPSGVGDCSMYTGMTTCNGDSACKWVTDECQRKWTKANSSTVTYPNFTDTGLTNDTIYWYYVTAYDTSYDPVNDVACDPQYRDPNDSLESRKVSATPGSSGIGRAVARGWNLMSVPAAAARSTARISVASAAGNSAIVRYDSAAGRYVEVPSASTGLGPGQGIWVYSDSDDNPLTYEGEINYSNEATIALGPRWNLVGNPFVNQFDWNDAHVEFSVDAVNFVPLSQATASGWLQGAWLFDNGSYPPLQSGATIFPCQGFWVKTSLALTIRLKQ